MLFCVAIVAMFPSMSLGAVTTCPSGYTTINESDAIYVSNTGSCSAGHTQLGGDMELKNCYTSQNAPMCTYYDEIYTAVYNCNGGSGDTSESVTYGNTFTPKTNVCTRANYEFDGWTIDGADVDDSFTWSYLSDKTLTARWKQVIYTAVYNCNGGSGDTSESVTYGNTFTPKTNVCTRSGYEFDGWTIDGTDVGNSFIWSYLSDKTLTAKWKLARYTASYDCNGGSGGTSETVTYGNTFTPKTNVCTHSGYNFDGWTIDGADVDDSFTWSYLSDKTLTAKWTLSCADNKMSINSVCVEPEFTITTVEMTAGSTFSFSISAKGTFYVDFDDGRGAIKIDRTNNTTRTKYTSNAYSEAGTHTIKMYGDATGYSTKTYVEAIAFRDNNNIKSVDGSLGAIFGGSSDYMFWGTFENCTSLESIPENLFAGVSGGADLIFGGTFENCTSLTEIPEKLFAGVSGSAWWMFASTFRGCTGLKSIPENLFAGVYGSAEGMFHNTFRGCTSLESIPENLFAGVYGSAEMMFYFTFEDCAGLRGYIPYNTFPGSDVLSVSTMSDTFYNTTLDKTCPAGTTQYITGFESKWGGRVSCVPCPNGVCYTVTQCGGDAGVAEKRCYYDAMTNGYTKCDDTCVYTSCNDGYIMTNGACVKFDPEFTITTTDTSDFSFEISAAGTYYLDCGNGEGVRTINKTNTYIETFTCANRTGNTIGLSGDATEYDASEWSDAAAISFAYNTKIQKVDGSLGAIFGGSTHDMFTSTFRDCTSLTSIPENLFAGVSGSANSMFADTFYGCTSLTSVPENLFAGMGGSAVEMFSSTFSGCTSLTSIPENLFAGVSGSAEWMFNSTFSGCTSLTSIPEKLFAGVSSSAGNMFYETFSGCTGLTSIPEKLFAGIGGSASYMFAWTFEGCRSLQSIPEKLFSGVSGGAYGMFFGTFRDCTSLQSIPENLFSNITEVKEGLFNDTFYGCASLKKLPDGLFKNLGGNPNLETEDWSQRPLSNTFYGCTNLSGYIPYDMFISLDNTDFYPSNMYHIFNNTNLDTACPAGTYQYITGFESAWDGKVSCAPCPNGVCETTTQCTDGGIGTQTCKYDINVNDYVCGTCVYTSCNDGYIMTNGACVKFEPEFTITTTSNTSSFSFQISAAGNYTIS